jgi:polysaccharide export outer membrane protein
MISNKLGFSNLILFSSLIAIFSSCSYKNREALLKTPYDADTIKNVFVINGSEQPKDYYNLIQPEDELAINNLQDIDLIVKRSEGGNSSTSGTTYATFRVNANGEIKLPKLGLMKVAGLNRAQAAKKIQEAYEQSQLKAPLIDVRIANAYVVVLGEASKQGKFIIDRENYELIDLLADVGGLLPTANKKTLKIFRGDRANPEIILVNLQDYNFLKNPKLKLRAKDIIYIEPKRSALASQNLQTYSAFIQIGLVVLNTALIIYSLTK